MTKESVLLGADGAGGSPGNEAHAVGPAIDGVKVFDLPFGSSREERGHATPDSDDDAASIWSASFSLSTILGDGDSDVEKTFDHGSSASELVTPKKSPYDDDASNRSAI